LAFGNVLENPQSVAYAAAPDTTSAPFSSQTVRQLARELAQKPYHPPDATLPPELKDLTYDQYRTIRFLPEHAWWRGDRLPFQAEFFHRGFYFVDRVEIFEVDQGQARRILYSPIMFSFGEVKPPPKFRSGLAGFRLRYPINRPDYYDEFAVFLGATYFRAIAGAGIWTLRARLRSTR
jgi:glucans biosynthesis protein